MKKSIIIECLGEQNASKANGVDTAQTDMRIEEPTYGLQTNTQRNVFKLKKHNQDIFTEKRQLVDNYETILRNQQNQSQLIEKQSQRPIIKPYHKSILTHDLRKSYDSQMHQMVHQQTGFIGQKKQSKTQMPKIPNKETNIDIKVYDKINKNKFQISKEQRFQSLDGFEKIQQKMSYNDQVRQIGAQTITKANDYIAKRRSVVLTNNSKMKSQATQANDNGLQQFQGQKQFLNIESHHSEQTYFKNPKIPSKVHTSHLSTPMSIDQILVPVQGPISDPSIQGTPEMAETFFDSPELHLESPKHPPHFQIKIKQNKRHFQEQQQPLYQYHTLEQAQEALKKFDPNASDYQKLLEMQEQLQQLSNDHIIGYKNKKLIVKDGPRFDRYYHNQTQIQSGFGQYFQDLMQNKSSNKNEKQTKMKVYKAIASRNYAPDFTVRNSMDTGYFPHIKQNLETRRSVADSFKSDLSELNSPTRKHRSIDSNDYNPKLEYKRKIRYHKPLRNQYLSEIITGKSIGRKKYTQSKSPIVPMNVNPEFLSQIKLNHSLISPGINLNVNTNGSNVQVYPQITLNIHPTPPMNIMSYQIQKQTDAGNQVSLETFNSPKNWNPL